MDCNQGSQIWKETPQDTWHHNRESAILQLVAFVISNMTVLRYLIWISKMANHRLISAPEWRVSTPPHPSEAFKQHVLAG